MLRPDFVSRLGVLAFDVCTGLHALICDYIKDILLALFDFLNNLLLDWVEIASVGLKMVSIRCLHVSYGLYTPSASRTLASSSSLFDNGEDKLALSARLGNT